MKTRGMSTKGLREIHRQRGPQNSDYPQDKNTRFAKEWLLCKPFMIKMNADITYSVKSTANTWQEIQKSNFPIDLLENLAHI